MTSTDFCPEVETFPKKKTILAFRKDGLFVELFLMAQNDKFMIYQEE